MRVFALTLLLSSSASSSATAAATITTASVPSLRRAEAAAAGTGGGESTVQSTVPFYLKKSASGKTVAVVYYGEPGDKSKEMEVVCALKEDVDHFTGPGSILCICFSETDCQLMVPFYFEYDDASGEVIGVAYKRGSESSSSSSSSLKDGEVLFVPFNSEVDADGNVIAVVVGADAESTESAPQQWSNLVIAGMVVVGLTFLAVVATGTAVFQTPKTSSPSSSADGPTVKEEADDATETGSCVGDLP